MLLHMLLRLAAALRRAPARRPALALLRQAARSGGAGARADPRRAAVAGPAAAAAGHGPRQGALGGLARVALEGHALHTEALLRAASPLRGHTRLLVHRQHAVDVLLPVRANLHRHHALWELPVVTGHGSRQTRPGQNA